ncbi:MAG: hypothetical protein KGL39_25700 [Patescibacteria group bacterium]|nr:hypothetical protein [Patescibacteria group bacterium]
MTRLLDWLFGRSSNKFPHRITAAETPCRDGREPALPHSVWDDITDDDIDLEFELEFRDAIDAMPGHFTGMSSLSVTLQTRFGVSGSNLPGSSLYGDISNVNTLSKQYTLGTAAGNTSINGCDEAVSFQQGIVAGGSATVNLNSQSNIVGQTIAPARIKSIQLRLLNAADDPTISPAPTATSTITVTNNGPATPAPVYFGSKGSGLTITITVSTGALNTVAIGAAGSGYLPSSTFIVTVNQAGGSGGVVYVTTNSSGVPTAVAIAAAGSGYSAATLPTTELGSMSLNTGDARMIMDTSATGLVVSATSCNFKIFNNDATHAVTFELDVPCGSS